MLQDTPAKTDVNQSAGVALHSETPLYSPSYDVFRPLSLP